MSRSRLRFAPRERASAWLGIASLLGLLLLQPAHGRSDRAHAQLASRAEATLAVSSDVASPARNHDAGSCQVCRAASQVRAGVRPALQHVAAPDLEQPLHAFAALLPSAAPALRDAWPRAPPARSA